MKHACKHASRLASDSLDRPLSFWEKIQLRLHLIMCRNCQTHESNQQIIRDVTILIRKTDFGQVRLSEAQRSRLHAALDELSADQGT